jgi:cytochrome c peroxidase
MKRMKSNLRVVSCAAAFAAVALGGPATRADEQGLASGVGKTAGASGVAVTLATGGAAAASAMQQPPPLAALPAPPIPADNKQSDAKVALGKLLFFDPRLGGDASVSCSSCHDPEQGWAWAEDFSRGYPGTVHWRNSQTIINSAYLGKQFWAGSASSHESQARSAARGGVAGNGESDLMEARLALIPEYRKAFGEVFGDEWPLIQNAWRAIAAFERTLVQRDAPIDRYLNGDSSALSEQQMRGKALFEGKAGCLTCHNGALASDQRYYNIGVPPAKRWEEDGLAQITFRFEQYAKGVTEEMYRTIKADAGLYYRSKNKWDKGKFRTPTLRYTMYTAPYMHNGAFYTLEEVIDFYDRGGMDEEGRTSDFPESKTPLIKPLGLSDSEKEDLIAFLEAFSGDEIVMAKPKLPEYAPLFSEAELQLD